MRDKFSMCGELLHSVLDVRAAIRQQFPGLERLAPQSDRRSLTDSLPHLRSLCVVRQNQRSDKESEPSGRPIPFTIAAMAVAIKKRAIVRRTSGAILNGDALSTLRTDSDPSSVMARLNATKDLALRRKGTPVDRSRQAAALGPLGI